MENSSIKKEKTNQIMEHIRSGREEGFKETTFPEKGRGVLTTRPFEEGAYLLEYSGELITDPKEASRREAEYSSGGSYLFFFKYENKHFCVDATKETKRLGRLLNHSRTHSNVRVRLLSVDGEPRLAFFASRDIDVGEELTYDYGDRRRDVIVANPWLKF